MDNIDINGILNKYGVYEGQFAESTDFGSLSPEMVVVNLLVDDGDKSRSNRKMLFKETYRKIGCGCVPHNKFKSVISNSSKDLIVFDKDNYEYTFTGQVCPIEENECSLRISMGVDDLFNSSGCDKGELVISEFTIQDTGWVPVENDKSSESVGPWGFYALFDAEHHTYGHWAKLS